MNEIVFDSLPSMLRYYPALARPRKLTASPSLPDAEIVLRRHTSLSSEVDKYRRVCGLPGSATMPLTWPQVVAGPLHAAMLAHPDFPFASLGLVHVRNTIRRHHESLENVPLDFKVWVNNLRPVSRGYEFDLNTSASMAERLLWESTTVVLAPARHKHPVENGERPALPSPLPEKILLRLPENLGRQYCMVSRDINPIHVHKLTARPFGFKKPIIHGMWSFARALGEIADTIPNGECTAQVDFIRPVYLPSSIRLGAELRDGISHWDIVHPDSGKILVYGHVKPGLD